MKFGVSARVKVVDRLAARALNAAAIAMIRRRQPRVVGGCLIMHCGEKTKSTRRCLICLDYLAGQERLYKELAQVEKHRFLVGSGIRTINLQSSLLI